MVNQGRSKRSTSKLNQAARPIFTVRLAWQQADHEIHSHGLLQRLLLEVSRTNFSEQYCRVCRRLVQTYKELSYEDEAPIYLVQQIYIVSIVIYPKALKGPELDSMITGIPKIFQRRVLTTLCGASERGQLVLLGCTPIVYFFACIFDVLKVSF